jgi:methionyl-tRNA formyltransferase
MKVALFCGAPTGEAIAECFRDAGARIAWLILDANADRGFNERIRGLFPTMSDERVLFHSELDETVVASMRRGPVDLGFLAWWPYIVREPLLSVPRLGILNCHPSWLPNARGKHTTFWTLVEGATFGVTIHFIDEGIDSGDIAFQKRLDITWTDTGQTLYLRAQSEIVELVRTSMARILSNDIPRTKQREGGSYHSSNELEIASRISLDATYTGRDLLNLLRARTFPPFPGASFQDNDETYDVRVSITRRG